MGGLHNSENPSLDLGYPALFVSQLRISKTSKRSVAVSPAHPLGGGVCVVLMRITTILPEAPAPQGRVHLH